MTEEFLIEHTETEPHSNIAVSFPGQDVQKPGMLEEIAQYPAGLEVIERADRLLENEFDFRVSEIAAKNTDSDMLRRTEFTQPAVFVLSVGLHNINKYHRNKEGYRTLPRYMTGNSMGIVTAIMLSGALTFEDGLRLAATRGLIMQKYGDPQPTGMKATLNAEESQVKSLLDKNPDLDLCLINSDSIFVYGGPLQPLQNMTDELKAQKVKVVDVNADRAMHSRYTRPARIEFDRFIDRLNFQTPLVPVVGTLTGKPIRTPEGIAEELKFGFDHTYDNRKILNFFNEAEIHMFSEVNEKGNFAKAMERMFGAVAAHKVEAGLGVVVAGIGLYEVLTRYHPHKPKL